MLPTPSADVSEKELGRILDFITQNGEIGKPQKPIQILAERVMLASFGWPSDSLTAPGYKKARAAILSLETQGKVECKWSPGKRLIAIRKKKEQPALEPEVKQIPSTLPPPNDLTAGDRRAASIRRTLAQMKPRGLAAREHDINRRGDRNEEWAHVSFLKLIEVLLREFPAIVLDGRCNRSGKHNLAKGKIDLQDHYGQDFAFHLTARHPNGPVITGYIIYDSKGSRHAVEEFNQKIIYHPGQNGALLKKAIWANSRLSSRKDFAREVVSDCLTVGLLPE